VSILIILYIINEFSYDRYHQNADQIYRIALTGQISGQPFETVATPVPLAPTMVMEFPEVINATRIFSSSNNTFFSYGDKKFYEKGILFTDSSFFNIFSKSVILL
jgi:putative ABC transport system permease protein